METLLNNIASGPQPNRTGNREQGTGNREQGTGNREQGTGNREQHVFTRSLPLRRRRHERRPWLRCTRRPG